MSYLFTGKADQSVIEAVADTSLLESGQEAENWLGYAGAFVSSLYTIAGAEPVEVRPDLAHLDVSTAAESYTPPSLATLRALADGEDVEAPRYLRHWPRDFQYVYLVGPHTEDALPGVLDEIARYRRFTLYAVRR